MKDEVIVPASTALSTAIGPATSGSATPGSATYGAFEALPTELRLRIYDFVFTPFLPEHLAEEVRSRLGMKVPRIYCDIIQTNRNIYWEAVEVLYKNAEFPISLAATIDNPHPSPEKALSGSRVSAHALSRTRSVTLAGRVPDFNKPGFYLGQIVLRDYCGVLGAKMLMLRHVRLVLDPLPRSQWFRPQRMRLERDSWMRMSLESIRRRHLGPFGHLVELPGVRSIKITFKESRCDKRMLEVLKSVLEEAKKEHGREDVVVDDAECSAPEVTSVSGRWIHVY